MDHVYYSTGSEYDPGDPFGLQVLTIEDGTARLEMRHQGTPRRWEGRVGAVTLDAVEQHLRLAGFPAVPPHALPAGSSLRELTIGSGDDAQTARIAYHEASKLPGYSDAFRLLDGIVVALSAGEVPVVPGPVEGVQVTEAHRAG